MSARVMPAQGGNGVETRRFKITGYIDLDQSEILAAEDADVYAALPECLRMNLEDLEYEEIDLSE